MMGLLLQTQTIENCIPTAAVVSDSENFGNNIMLCTARDYLSILMHHFGAFLKTQKHKNLKYDMLKYKFCVLS
jgi:hypothetical protein